MPAKLRSAKYPAYKSSYYSEFVILPERTMNNLHRAGLLLLKGAPCEAKTQAQYLARSVCYKAQYFFKR